MLYESSNWILQFLQSKTICQVVVNITLVYFLLMCESLTLLYAGKEKATNIQSSMESESYTRSSCSLPQQQQSPMEIATAATNSPDVPACDKFAVQMKQGQKVRSYQHELAKPGIDGENYIIFAPTNSGKTLTAALVISDHLKRNPREQKGLGPKVIMVVKTRLLADQQTKRLKEYIPGARVECSRGNDCEEDSQQSEQLPSVSDALRRSDIVVCTAGKVVDGLRKGNLAINNVSLLVLDECHNTDKGSNYAQVMHAYLEQKIDQRMQGNQLPQIVGLTATPGVGKNLSLNPLKEVDKLISLCALVDASSGIKFVKENVEELNRVVPKSEYRKATVKQSDQREKFIQRVVADMEICETFLTLEFDGKFTRWSQAYEQEVKKMKTALEESDNPSDKDKVSTIRVLECLCQTLMAYMDLPYALATTPLKEYEDLNIPEKVISDHDKQLKEMLTKLESDLAQLPSCENPILDKAKEILADRLQRNPKSEGIIFVRTREQAKAISEWISESRFAQEIGVRPHMLLGHKRPEETGPSMSDAEQKAVVAAFHSGKYNLLIATSVAEEGLDIKQCNLVMRLHVSSAKSKAQMQGRARAEDSEIVTIMSDDPQKHYKDILNDEQLLLTEQVVQYYLPSCYDRFEERLANKQREIVENVKSQRGAQKQRMRTHPAQNVELKCKKCKAVACRGSDLYAIDKTDHHVVPGNVLYYDIHDHRNPGMKVCEFDGSVIKKFHKVHCSECGTSWGALGYWPKSKNEFPILKCCSFNFFINGVQDNFNKWKKRPFEVSPLSQWFAQNNN